jgi:hypothetical protein
VLAGWKYTSLFIYFQPAGKGQKGLIFLHHVHFPVQGWFGAVLGLVSAQERLKK